MTQSTLARPPAATPSPKLSAAALHTFLVVSYPKLTKRLAQQVIQELQAQGDEPVKQVATRLRSILARHDLPLKQAAALEAAARIQGHASWHETPKELREALPAKPAVAAWPFKEDRSTQQAPAAWPFKNSPQSSVEPLLNKPGKASMKTELEAFYLSFKAKKGAYDEAQWMSLRRQFKAKGMSLPAKPDSLPCTLLDGLFALRFGRRPGLPHDFLAAAYHYLPTLGPQRDYFERALYFYERELAYGWRNPPATDWSSTKLDGHKPELDWYLPIVDFLFPDIAPKQKGQNP